MTTQSALRLLPVLLLLGVTACSDTQERPPSREAPPPMMDTAPAKPATVEWTVTPTGVGPIRVGMTLAQAREALNGALVVREDTTAPCFYVRPGKGPEKVSFMVTNGQIARVDVQNDSIATEAGAHVGDTEERIKSLYPGLEVQPHKYTNGHYLIVKPEAGESRIIFETDGATVTMFRAGKLPEVEWVETCY